MPIPSYQRRKIQELLVRLRQAAGLRQTDVAKTLGRPQSFVSKYEQGERRLDIVELREVCSAIGITLSDFVQRIEGELS